MGTGRFITGTCLGSLLSCIWACCLKYVLLAAGWLLVLMLGDALFWQARGSVGNGSVDHASIMGTGRVITGMAGLACVTLLWQARRCIQLLI
jgi:hypothetical protein